MAVGTHGDAVIVWLESDGGIVRAAARPAGGDWRAPVDLAARVYAVEAEGALADVTVDGRGDAVAVWSRGAAGGSRVQAATYRVGG